MGIICFSPLPLQESKAMHPWQMVIQPPLWKKNLPPTKAVCSIVEHLLFLWFLPGCPTKGTSEQFKTIVLSLLSGINLNNPALSSRWCPFEYLKTAITYCFSLLQTKCSQCFQSLLLLFKTLGLGCSSQNMLQFVGVLPKPWCLELDEIFWELSDQCRVERNVSWSWYNVPNPNVQLLIHRDTYIFFAWSAL